jgi:hypothetical protein
MLNVDLDAVVTSELVAALNQQSQIANQQRIEDHKSKINNW